MAKDFKESMVRYLKSIGIDYDVSEIDVELIDFVDLEPWVSVNDRLPNDCDLVLFRLGNLLSPKTEKGIWLAGAGTFETEYSCEFYSVDEVTHWMPLPEPPK